MTETQRNAYREGWNATKNNLGQAMELKNPYPPGSYGHEYWNQGRTDALMDAKREMSDPDLVHGEL